MDDTTEDVLDADYTDWLPSYEPLPRYDLPTHNTIVLLPTEAEQYEEDTAQTGK